MFIIRICTPSTIPHPHSLPLPLFFTSHFLPPRSFPSPFSSLSIFPFLISRAGSSSAFWVIKMRAGRLEIGGRERGWRREGVVVEGLCDSDGKGGDVCVCTYVRVFKGGGPRRRNHWPMSDLHRSSQSGPVCSAHPHLQPPPSHAVIIQFKFPPRTCVSLLF